MRVASENSRAGKADSFKHLRHATAAFLRGKLRLVNQKRLGDDRPDFHARVQRSGRILKHHLDSPAHRSQARATRAEKVLFAEYYFTGVRLNESEEHACESR